MSNELAHRYTLVSEFVVGKTELIEQSCGAWCTAARALKRWAVVSRADHIVKPEWTVEKTNVKPEWTVEKKPAKMAEK